MSFNFFSNLDFGDFYSDNSLFIDFLISFSIFTAIVRLALEKSFSKNTRSFNLLSASIGLALAFSVILLERRFESQVIKIKIYILYLIIIGGFLAVTHYLKQNWQKSLYLIVVSLALLHNLTYLPIESYPLQKAIRQILLLLLVFGIIAFCLSLKAKT